ncbi:hypothetical protein GCM10028807_52370 [Spirosoma daeguense]
MKTQPEKIARPGHKGNPSVILKRWSLAIETLYISYTELNNWVRSHLQSRRPGDVLTRIGQCSVSQAVRLLTKIQEELKSLISDMDMNESAYPELLNADENYRTLIDHTLRLEKLNTQARQLLQLATLPPC